MMVTKQGYVAVTFSPDSKTVAVAEGTAIELADVASGQLRALPGRMGQGFIDSLSFSPDGRVLAGADYSIRRWDVGTRQELASLGFPYGHLFYIAAHPRAVRHVRPAAVVDTLLRNVYRVRRRLTEYALAQP